MGARWHEHLFFFLVVCDKTRAPVSSLLAQMLVADFRTCAQCCAGFVSLVILLSLLFGCTLLASHVVACEQYISAGGR